MPVLLSVNIGIENCNQAHFISHRKKLTNDKLIDVRAAKSRVTCDPRITLAGSPCVRS